MKKKINLSLLIISLCMVFNHALGQLSTPPDFHVEAYELHTFLRWGEVANSQGYKVYLSLDNVNFTLRDTVDSGEVFYTDFVASMGTNLQLYYRVTSFSGSDESTPTATIRVQTATMSDEDFLTMTEEATFRYFYDFAHPVSGLTRESKGRHNPDICTIGGSGFGIMALLVGIERGFITRQEGVLRIKKIVDFLETADRFHGVWPHWLHGATGNVIPFSYDDDGGDLVESSFLVQGLLTARQYFNAGTADENYIVQKITELWESVEWDWYSRNDSGVLYWHWSPNYLWQKNFALRGYYEALITYVLAIASPTHPVPASYWHTGWCSNTTYTNSSSYYGYEVIVGPDATGPLFWMHYSFLGFDPRGIKDDYANYFQAGINWTLINQAYCIDNPGGYAGYGTECWGLTASFNPFGYSAHSPQLSRDNGTITPTAALSSIVYTPEESVAALKHFYREHGSDIWGNYGFTDAFNVSENWAADFYLAIDQGPIIDMIENYRSQLLWNNFMADQEIITALNNIGFVPDSGGGSGGNEDRENLALGKPVTAVSSYNNNDALNPNINDNNLLTRWSSLWQNNQYVYIDLEDEYLIDSVVLNWETAYGSEYKIQVSSDGLVWSDVFHETNGNGAIDIIEFSPTAARYVKMWGITAASSWGFSIWEMEIYGESSTDPKIPVADFSSDKNIIQEGETISFSDLSLNNPDTWSWTFSGGDPSSSTLQNPTITYNVAGTYDVMLTVSNVSGTDTRTQNAFITVEPPSDWVELSYSDFENGWGIWTDGGKDCSLNSLSLYAHEGMYSANIQDNSGTSSSFYHTNGIDLTAYEQIKAEFWYYTRNLFPGVDAFLIEYFDGVRWIVVKELLCGRDFNNSAHYFESISLEKTNYNFPTDAKFRFRCDAQDNRDDIYIDEIRISATDSQDINKVSQVKINESIALEQNPVFDVNVYPNPVTSGSFNVDLSGSARQVSVYIYTSDGRLTFKQENTENSILQISTENFAAGNIYFLKIIYGGQVITKKVLIE